MYKSELVNLRSIKWEITRNLTSNQRVDLFRFLLGFLQKKEHFIEYLVQVLWFERNRCQNAWSFSMSQKEALTIFSLKSDFKAYFINKTLNIRTYRRWNMYCIERITHLRNPISYIWLIFSHICSNYKGTVQIFHDFKENCRITLEFSDKVDSNKYSTVP
jgi:hypothetical protein